MKLSAEIFSLSTKGDYVEVRCQGECSRDAAWRPNRIIVFDVTEHEAKRMRIGGLLRITVQAAR